MSRQQKLRSKEFPLKHNFRQAEWNEFVAPEINFSELNNLNIKNVFYRRKEKIHKHLKSKI